MKSEHHFHSVGTLQERVAQPHKYTFVVEDSVLHRAPSPVTVPAPTERKQAAKHARIKLSQPMVGVCQRTLIVGADEKGLHLANDLLRHFPGDFKIVGFVSTENNPTEAEDVPRPFPILGSRENLRDVVREHRIERVMFTDCVEGQMENSGFQVRAPQDRRSLGRPGTGRTERRREVADLYKCASSPAFHAPNSIGAKAYNVAKRTFDIVMSLTALIATAPLAAVIFPIMKMTSPGPIFYQQERVGMGGKSFTIYKLRTMRLDAESKSGPMLSPYGDTRSTPMGKFMRATKLDELPQFWNVLKGEMSVVGPRPERPFFVEPFSGHIYSYSLRHSVRPGLTGLAQIKGDHLTNVYVKLHFDLIYVCNRSLMWDLAILARTPLTILRLIRGKA